MKLLANHRRSYITKQENILYKLNMYRFIDRIIQTHIIPFNNWFTNVDFYYWPFTKHSKVSKIFIYEYKAKIFLRN